MTNFKYIIIGLVLILFAALFTPIMLADDTKTINKNQMEFKLRKEEITFIPFTELNKLLNKNKKLVYMSYAELRKLIDEKSKIRPLAPVNYVIKDLNLNGTAFKDHVSFDATYKIEILNKEWTYIPILSTQVGLKSASFDGKPAPLSTEGNNFRILSDKLGNHNLNLKFDVKLTETGNSKNFNFNMPILPITRLKIVVNETPIKLNISNSSGLRAEVKNGKTTTYANLVGQGIVQVDWKTNLIKMPKPKIIKIEEKEDLRPSKVITDVKTIITLDEGIMQGYSTYNCQIYHKPLEKLNLIIPDDKDLEIISVTSPGDMVKKGNPIITDPNGSKPGKLLTVYFNKKIKDNAVFNIAFEKSFDNTKTTNLLIPDIYLTGKEISKTSGYIAIQSAANIEIKQSLIKDISVVDISDLPFDLTNLASNPILLSYSFIKGLYQLELQVIPHKDAGVMVVMIDKAKISTVLSSNGVVTTLAEYTIRNMSENYLKFALPENSEILDSKINNQLVQVGKEKIENKEIYNINIKSYQDEKPFSLSIMYKQDLKFNFITKGINMLNIMAPDILNMPLLTFNWTLLVPERLKYWMNTDLNKGYSDYSRYISDGNIPISAENKETIYNEKDKMQVANVMEPVEGQAMDAGKVAGILPPEFNLPPTDKGFISYNFSDYLLEQGAPKISVYFITKFINFPIFIIMLVVGWLIAKKTHKLIQEKDNIKDRSVFTISAAILLYIAGSIFGFGSIWWPVILACLVYVVIITHPKILDKLNLDKKATL